MIGDLHSAGILGDLAKAERASIFNALNSFPTM